MHLAIITSDRWYRYVNTKTVESGLVGIAYDPVPFVPGMGADHFGHLLILPDDTTAIAYIGLDAQDRFSPLNVKGFKAHSMVHAKGSPYPGYMDRIDALMKTYRNGTYPIETTGFHPGSLCVRQIIILAVHSHTLARREM